MLVMDYLKRMLCIIVVLPISSAFVTYATDNDLSCIGSMDISYEDEEGNIDILTLQGQRTSYPNLRRGFPVMRLNSISHINVGGNCCWKIYPERLFDGEPQFIFPGSGTVYVDFQPISIKKLECPFY